MCGGGGFGGFIGSVVHSIGDAISSGGSAAIDAPNTALLNPLSNEGKKLDTAVRKDNPISRAKRKAGEAEAQMIADEDRKAAEANAALLSTEQNNNQTLQAETVALRRRKAAQSLLRLGSGARPDEEGSVAGNSNLARGAAYGVRQGVSLGG